MQPYLIEDPALRGKKDVFASREEAGTLLELRLRDLVTREGIVLAIPSGGVPVACSIAREMGLPLDVVVVRKIQIPGNAEAGFGAVGPNGEVYLHDRIVEDLRLTAKEINQQVDKARDVLKKREALFRRKATFPSLKGRQVILVDDGLATGYTMLAAVDFVRQLEARQVLVAVPTASQRTVAFLLPEVDVLVCLNVRSGPIFAVADAYQDWHDLDEREAASLLFEAQEKIAGSGVSEDV